MKMAVPSPEPALQAGTVPDPIHEAPLPLRIGVADRYWLVTLDDQELRFSLQEVAERCAAALIAHGVPVELSRHGLDD